MKRLLCVLTFVSVTTVASVASVALAGLDFDGTPWTLEYDGVGLPTGGAGNFDNIAMNSSQFNANDRFADGDQFPGWLTANGNPGGVFGKPYPYTGMSRSAGWTFEWRSVSVAGTQVTSSVHEINDNDSMLRIDYGNNQVTLRDGYPGSGGGGMTSVASVNLSGMAEHTFRLTRQPGSPTVELYIDGNFGAPAAQITPFSYAGGFNHVLADATNLNSMYLGNSLYENAYDFVRMHGGATPVATPPPPSMAAPWSVGRPVITYYEGASTVTLTDAVAQQAVDGGFNVVLVRSKAQLDLAHQYGLRGMWDGPLDANTILDIRSHPALYSYYLYDEPGAGDFSQLAGRVKYLRTIDPAHMSYVALFPTYATNAQLGTSGDTVTAYNSYLSQYTGTVQPSIINYDHYNFFQSGDGDQYFLNLSMVSQAARQAGTPFMNTVQASAWDPSWRVPNANELRFLNYTSLAYGAQGMSYWAYNTPNPNSGGLAPVNGSPTAVFTALTTINREFEAIADQVQHLDSIGAYHVGNQPCGTTVLPGGSPFSLSGGTTAGLIGLFGRDDQLADAIYALVVNLNYTAGKTTTVFGPGNLSIFNPVTRVWSPAGSSQVLLNLLPGGGVLVGLTSEIPMPGDADRDGDVDFSDLTALATSYGILSRMRWQNGDFNWDGDVDLSDLTLLASHYGGGQAQAFADFNLLSVPEPAGLASLAMVVGIGARLSRRRAAC